MPVFTALMHHLIENNLENNKLFDLHFAIRNQKVNFFVKFSDKYVD